MIEEPKTARIELADEEEGFRMYVRVPVQVAEEMARVKEQNPTMEDLQALKQAEKNLEQK